MTVPACRFCRAPLTQTFLDLGDQPLANSYLTKAQLDAGTEGFYPLHTRVCLSRLTVQGWSDSKVIGRPRSAFSAQAEGQPASSSKATNVGRLLRVNISGHRTCRPF